MGRNGKGALYLHIGRHKCGTSTLQHFLSNNEAGLAALGFHYPKALRRPVAHHPLAYWYNPDEVRARGIDAGAFAPELDAFWQEVAAHDRVIVSSEAFQNNDPMLMRADLAGFDLTIVAYLREPLDYLLSAYAQRVKGGGGSERLDQFVDWFRPDYEAFLGAWRAAFPGARLVVRVFERDRLAGRDIRRDFLGVIGVALPGQASLDFPDRDNNVTIGGALLEFMRRFNGRGLHEGPHRHQLYAAIQALAADHAEYRLKPALPAELQAEIRGRHAQSLQRVADAFWGGAPLFDAKTFPEGPIEHVLSQRAHDRILARLEAYEPSLATSVEALLAGGGPLYDR